MDFPMGKKFKILLVDDDDNIRQLLDLKLQKMIDSPEIIEAHSGNSALKILTMHQMFDLIICDFDMDDGNGAAFYQGLKATGQTIPFILHTTKAVEEVTELGSQFPSAEDYEAYIQKPFSNASFLALAGKLFPQNILRSAKSGAMIPVKIYYFYRFAKTLCDLYVKIGEQKYIKIIHSDESYSKIDIDKYIKKNQKFLFIKENDFRKFSDGFTRLPFLLSDPNNSDNNAEAIKTTHAYIHTIVQEVGLTKTAIEATNDIVKRVIDFPQKGNNDLMEMLAAHRKRQDYIYDHSYMVSQMATSICRSQDWSTKDALKKLVIAALFHDITIDNPDVAYIQDLADPNLLHFSFEEQKSFESHPVKASELIRKVRDFPPDVDRIILQHHEKMSGLGFPRGIDHNGLAPLSTIFIIAHQIVSEIYKYNFDENSYKQLFKELEGHYSKGNFKKIYLAFLKSIL